MPVKVPAKTPFITATTKPAKIDPNFTVVDYLKSARAKNPQVGFSTRWWAHEPFRSVIFALVGMALLGGICPPLIGVLTGAGFSWREKKPKEPEYDLSRFGKSKPQPQKPGKHQPTEQEIAHLRELEAELEQKLASKDDTGVAVAPGEDDAPSSAAASGKTEQPVKKLTSGPLEAVADDKPKQLKRFSGEFYPTETHVKHDDQT